MRTALFFLLLTAAPKSSDDDLDRQLNDTIWQSPNVGDAQVPIYLRDTFKPDHSVTSDYFAKSGAGMERAAEKPSVAHWEVESGYVLIGKMHGKELFVSAKRELHVDAKGNVTRMADWTRVDEPKK